MENNTRERSQKVYNNFRRVYDLSMAVLFIGMGFAMFFLERLKLNLVITDDTGFRYFFGGICLLYGGFRLYRGIKQPGSI